MPDLSLEYATSARLFKGSGAARLRLDRGFFTSI